MGLRSLEYINEKTRRGEFMDYGYDVKNNKKRTKYWFVVRLPKCQIYASRKYKNKDGADNPRRVIKKVNTRARAWINWLVEHGEKIKRGGKIKERGWVTTGRPGNDAWLSGGIAPAKRNSWVCVED